MVSILRIGALAASMLAACGPAGGPKGRLGTAEPVSSGEEEDPTHAQNVSGAKDAGIAEPDPDETCVEPNLAAIQQEIFIPACARSGCHFGMAPAADLSLARSPEELAMRLRAPATQSPSGMPLVTPRQIGSSYLFLKITLPNPLAGDPMPPEGRLDDCEIAAVRAWIESGAE
jgi:hypothetical protein